MRPGGGSLLGRDRERPRSSHPNASCTNELRWEWAGVDRQGLEFGHEGQGFVMTGHEGGRRLETGPVVDAAGPPWSASTARGPFRRAAAPPFGSPGTQWPGGEGEAPHRKLQEEEDGIRR